MHLLNQENSVIIFEIGFDIFLKNVPKNLFQKMHEKLLKRLARKIQRIQKKLRRCFQSNY